MKRLKCEDCIKRHQNHKKRKQNCRGNNNLQVPSHKTTKCNYDELTVETTNTKREQIYNQPS